MKKIMMLATILVAGLLFIPNAYAEESCPSDFANGTCEEKGDTINVKLTNNDTINSTITIDKNVTIDLAGHNITINSSNNIDKAFNIQKGTVTIKGPGKIINESENSNGGTFYVYGSSSTHLIIEQGVTVEGINPVVVSNNGTNTGIVVDVYGNLVNNKKGNSDQAALIVHGNIKTGDVKINVYGNLSSTVGAGLFQAGLATTTISGNITGLSGVAIKSGTLNLNKAIVTATGEYKEGKSNENGYEPTGAAIQVESTSSYAGNININLNGGTYTSQKGNTIEEYGEAKNLNALNVALNTNLKSANGKEVFTTTVAPRYPEGAELRINADGTYTVIDPTTISNETKKEEANPNTSDINLYLLLSLIAASGCGIAYTIKRRFN